MVATSVLSAAPAFLVLICALGDGMGELCGCVDGGDGCRVSGSDMADGAVTGGELAAGTVAQLLHTETTMRSNEQWQDR
jgi:hypothetical protein